MLFVIGLLFFILWNTKLLRFRKRFRANAENAVCLFNCSHKTEIIHMDLTQVV